MKIIKYEVSEDTFTVKEFDILFNVKKNYGLPIIKYQEIIGLEILGINDDENYYYLVGSWTGDDDDNFADADVVDICVRYLQGRVKPNENLWIHPEISKHLEFKEIPDGKCRGLGEWKKLN